MRHDDRLRPVFFALLGGALLAVPAGAQEEERVRSATEPEADPSSTCEATASEDGAPVRRPRRARVAPLPPLTAPGGNRAGDDGVDRGVRIDTVIVRGGDIFTAGTADRSFFHGLLNDLHVETRGGVIRQELLLGPGDRFDCALARETERNLRQRGIFREVSIDTARMDDRLALVVATRDAWTLEPRLDVRVASDGTLAGAVGATERNLAGTGHLLQARYVRDVDRDGLVLGARVDRVAGTDLLVGAAYQDLSDRTAGAWTIGRPFRSLSGRWALSVEGEAFRGRVLQFRTPEHGARETLEWRREAFTNGITVAHAPLASPLGYLRVGATAEWIRESFGPWSHDTVADPPALPDSSTGLVGAFAEWRQADYRLLRHFNGFMEEDVDLSRGLRLSAKVSPEGTDRSGVGVRLVGQAGAAAGPALLRGRLQAGGILGEAPVDSGRVVANGSAALLPAERHVSFLDLAGGIQWNPYPGEAFDLGFLAGPRLWPPHAFSGTRMARLTLEHRWYALEHVLDALGIGFGAFFDYGGAWYRGDEARLGGDVGVSLLFGWELGPSARVGQVAAGYLFGGGIGDGGRWAISLGSGVAF